MGHWRAINPDITRFITVTSGASDAQVRAVRGPDLSDSQADSGGSIPLTRSTLTRSNLKAQITGPDLDCSPDPLVVLLIFAGYYRAI